MYTKPYLILTAPKNKKLLDTAPEDFYREMNVQFNIKLDSNNTAMLYDFNMSDERIHFFKFSEYQGYIIVIEEKDTDEKVSSQH